MYKYNSSFCHWTGYTFKYPVRWQKLLDSARSGSTALSYQNCVITLVGPDEDRISHVVSHIVWWKKTKKHLNSRIKENKTFRFFLKYIFWNCCEPKCFNKTKSRKRTIYDIISNFSCKKLICWIYQISHPS